MCTHLQLMIFFHVFQNCVEPSLHRSVLICNTLRHIEQEIRNEDEAADESLKSRERLPSFWPSSPPNNPGNPNSQNNCFPPPPGPGGAQSTNQPQITDTRPNLALGGLGGGSLQPGLVGGGVIPSLGAPGNPGMLGGPPPTSPGGHDPYLTPNPYSEAPYLSAYDYNSPRPTPFHTTSYDYEQDLLLPPPANASPSSTAPSQASSQNSSVLMGDVTSATSSLLECDSGYSDDLEMSLGSYYYGSPIPPPVSLIAGPPPVVTSSHPSSADFNGVVSMSSSLTGASNSSVPVSSSVGGIQVSPICSSSVTTPVVQSNVDCTQNPYALQCSPNGFQQLPPLSTDSVMGPHLLTPPQGGEHLTALQSPQPSVCSTSPLEIDDVGGGDHGDMRDGTAAATSQSSSSIHIGSGAGTNNVCGYTTASSSSPSGSCDQSPDAEPCTTTTNPLPSTITGSPTEEQSDPGSGRTSPHAHDPSNSPSQQSLCSMPSIPVSPMITPSQLPVTCATTSSSTISNNNNNNSISGSSSNNNCSSTPSSSSLANTFAQQDSQCGLESRRSDLSRNVGNHYNNHSLPMMDSLISPAYSSSSL